MKTILYVDDSEEMIELVQLVLSRSGYQLLTLSDTENTVDYILENKPDLVILDINMPGMDGIEVVRNVRKQQFTNPIIMFTASTSERDKEKAFQAGCDEYIVKDLEMQSLGPVLDSYLRKAGGGV
ncbi:MAG: response regulator [Gammaproteobacteria bacterium]